MHHLTLHRPGNVPAHAPGSRLAALEALRDTLKAATAAGPAGPFGLDAAEAARRVRSALADAFGADAGRRGAAFETLGVAPGTLPPGRLDRGRVLLLLGGVESIIASLRPATTDRSFPALDALLDEVEAGVAAGLHRLCRHGLKAALAVVHEEAGRRHDPYRGMHMYGGGTTDRSLDGLRRRGFASQEETRQLAWLESSFEQDHGRDVRRDAEALRAVGRRVAGAAPSLSGEGWGERYHPGMHYHDY